MKAAAPAKNPATRYAELFLEGYRHKRRREIVSPEGVPLSVNVASVGDRIAAYLIDIAIMTAVTIGALFVLLFLIQLGLVSDFISWVIYTALYVAKNAYFLHFELRWQGATPGKRIVGLRVVDRRGGPLTPGAVFARNLVRDFETLIPAQFVLFATGFDQVFAFIWLICMCLLPFLNRDRMRAGDFIGGTMVIALKRQTLSDDLADGEFRFTFTANQLQVYGTFELQVLEELLRRTTGPDADALLHDVGEKIRRKIGWKTPVAREQEVMFLRDFYAAERAFLEREQLFGKVKKDKHHATELRQNGNAGGVK
jgi:uncharacterized RDD family membrane protein YckC